MTQRKNMTEDDSQLAYIVEGALLAAGQPLRLEDLERMFPPDTRPGRAALRTALQKIAAEYENRPCELREVAGGFRLCVRNEYAEWISRLWEERPQRYSRALLETLALIVYRQPLTRGDIEKVRGVAVSQNILRTLLERDWISVVGHREVPGRPALYATTQNFLDDFNLKSLDQLPPLSEVRELVSEESLPELHFHNSGEQEAKSAQIPVAEAVADPAGEKSESSTESAHEIN